MLHFTLTLLLILSGIGMEQTRSEAKSPPGRADAKANPNGSLPEARRGFKTKLIRRESSGEPVPKPPPRLFRVVHYDSPAGKLAAYLSQSPNDGKRHPAIIWITGGDCNTIDEIWKEAPADNDQTAGAFRKAGIAMMYPSLRGGNNNPGFREGFFGEVDDILAASDLLARQDFVDPKQIYLGGHSTGGTLVLLVAASGNRFRAVFSFGPAHDVRGYPPEYIPFDTSNRREIELRSPILWVDSMRSPVYIFEGTEEPCNLNSVKALARASKNPLVHVHTVAGANHFSILSPVTRLVASKVLRDKGPTTNLTFTEAELNRLFAR